MENRRITSNRREALWEVGLYARPPRNVQVTLPVSMEDSVPRLADFTLYERMVGEYRVMGIYPRGHLMEFRQANSGCRRASHGGGEGLQDGERVKVAGWPAARQHPKGRNSTVFVTIE